jgi:hypothetical protein
LEKIKENIKEFGVKEYIEEFVRIQSD